MRLYHFALACHLVLLCGCGSNVSVHLTGAVQKGPFVLGSTIQLSTVDSRGNPTGQVFPSQTTDDLGGFSLSLPYQGNASIEGTGFYWNEATGQLSNATLTLRAFCNVTNSNSQTANVNIVTHLTHERVRTLLAASPHPVLSDAVQQAESELRASLGIGGSDFDPRANGIALNVAGGDSDGNAYLFAVSAILASIAQDEAGAGSVDAQLQQLINTISSSFAATGDLSADLRQRIAAVQQSANPLGAAPPSLDPQAFMDQLATRFAQVGSNAIVPDLNRVWDTDGDGIPNKADNCALVYNPDQAPVNSVCRVAFRSYETNGAAAVADFTGDGKVDVVGWTYSRRAITDPYVLPGDGAGGLGPPIVTPESTTMTLMTFPFSSLNQDATGQTDPYSTGPFPWVGDIDQDGHSDLLVEAWHIEAGAFSYEYSALLGGDGAGQFAPGIPVPTLPTSQSNRLLHQPLIADFDNDGLNDVLGTSVDNTTVWLARGVAPRSWAAPTQITSIAGVIVRGTVVADFNGDGKADVAFASHASTNGSNTFAGGIYVLLGTGSKTEPFFTAAPGSPITSFGTALTSLHTTDFEKDGKADLIAGVGQDVVVLLGDGTGQFGRPIVATGAGTAPDTMVWVYPGDFTSDGKTDLLTWSFGSPVRLFIGSGSGFPSSTPIWIPGFRPDALDVEGHGLLVADLNADGVSDILASVYGVNDVVGRMGSLTTVLINPR